MGQLNELSAAEAARRIGAGDITSEEVVRDCLARIEEREPERHAWAHIDPELALRQARACDAGPSRGRLHGVPIGVKDVLDTCDMPTQMGSPIYQGHCPPIDASCVALVRAAGAVILGKTVTAEFAGIAPGATTNPHNPAHTPGGSSSGSGAAVADCMVPVGFGTQTGGSVLRPASFCGTVGYKPTFGTFNRAGLKFAAESLDTIGLLSRTVEDAELLLSVLTGRELSHPAFDSPPSIGLCRTPLWETAQPETVEAVEDAAARLAAAGAAMREIVLPDIFAELSPARDVVNSYERSRCMAHEWEHHRDQLSKLLFGTITRGMEMPYEEYQNARGLIRDCRAHLGGIFEGLDVLLVPCAIGEAPKGLESTGNSGFQGLWTMMHTPSIALPTHRGPNGLPVGIQLVAPLREDERLLKAAEWALDTLGVA
jgi:amidase